jgi:hypothetical protein
MLGGAKRREEMEARREPVRRYKGVEGTAIGADKANASFLSFMFYTCSSWTGLTRI